MAVKIIEVNPDGPAFAAGIRPGETLISMNGHEIVDILDYRFHETNQHLAVEVEDPAGKRREVTIRKGEYESIGLEFETYLMDKQHSCRNKCIFCFIDQLPKGMRETLYFKDDDSRLSFLFGNYITLTNLSEHEISRIIEMHISPINVSVHTTNPELRVKMMHNRFAGETLGILRRFAEAGIKINCQLVLCPGINDGEELRCTLSDLESMCPSVQSIAAVPVGLTCHRQGLFPLRPFQKEEAAAVIDLINTFSERFLEKFGDRIVYAADEFYLIADRPIPDAAFYGDFAQLENGVGLVASLKQEFDDALEMLELPVKPRRVSSVTGMAAYPFLRGLLDELRRKCDTVIWDIYPIQNDFFGHTIDVTGLVTGGDIIRQLRGKDLGEALLVPSVMLRHEGDLFLDDVSVADVERELNIPVIRVKNDGYELLDAVIGSDAICQSQ